jgi:hypothetical protein
MLPTNHTPMPAPKRFAATLAWYLQGADMPACMLLGEVKEVKFWVRAEVSM